MPTIETVEGFVVECRRRGITLTAAGDSIKATGKPPANPEKFAAFLKAKKPEMIAFLTAPPHPVEEEVHRWESILYNPGDQRGELLAWALAESLAGRLPEPSQAIKLYNGAWVGGNDGSSGEWFISAYQEALLLPSSSAQFLSLRQSMKEVAIWASDWTRWWRTVETHRGETSLWREPHSYTIGVDESPPLALAA